jgi:hypothetical protein
MLKKTFMLTLPALVVSLQILAATAQQSTNSNVNEKYRYLKRDHVDSTDTLAIPLDESEIEQEEEINLDEGKKVFELPSGSESSKPANPSTINH